MGHQPAREASNSVGKDFLRTDPTTGLPVPMDHMPATQVAKLLKVRVATVREAARLDLWPHYSHGPRATPYFSELDVAAIVAMQERAGLRVVDGDQRFTNPQPEGEGQE
jgi:hypothetical protein